MRDDRILFSPVISYGGALGWKCECKEGMIFPLVFIVDFKPGRFNVDNKSSWRSWLKMRWRGEWDFPPSFFPESTSGFGCKKGQVCKGSVNDCAHFGEDGAVEWIEATSVRDDCCLPSVVLGIVFTWRDNILLLLSNGACVRVCAFWFDAEVTDRAWFTWGFVYWICNHEILFPTHSCICPQSGQLAPVG